MFQTAANESVLISPHSPLQILLTVGLASAVVADFGGGGHGGHNSFGGGGGGFGGRAIGRTGRQNTGAPVSIPGGVDFSNCQQQPDGTCCVIKESRVTSLQKGKKLSATFFLRVT